jgi:hypothetical protein
MPNDQEVNPEVAQPALASQMPQFATAEYAHVPGTERCRICSNLISGEYFRVNGQMACSKCAAEARDGQPVDSHAAFARGVLLGCGAAVLGLILFAAVAIITGWTIGYVSLAVGWLVGTAIIKGSNGMGGRRYQVAALLLTYFAISMAAIPIAISYYLKHQKPAEVRTQGTAEPGQSATSPDADANTPAPDASSQAQTAPKPKRQLNLGGLIGQLLFFGLASPFLELQKPFNGILGLVILFVGLRIAYRLTAARQLEVDGPYRVTG